MADDQKETLQGQDLPSKTTSTDKSGAEVQQNADAAAQAEAQPQAQSQAQAQAQDYGHQGRPLPQNSQHAYPQHQSQMQNTGMAVGGAVGMMSDGGGGGMVGDMLVGGVVGGMVGQRMAQAENHAYWREKALEYREGRAAGVIPPPQENPEEKAPWWSRKARAQRREKRWERRAERRG